MTPPEPEKSPTPPENGASTRSKLWGRLLIVALGLLVLGYIIPLFRH